MSVRSLIETLFAIAVVAGLCLVGGCKANSNPDDPSPFTSVNYVLVGAPSTDGNAQITVWTDGGEQSLGATPEAFAELGRRIAGRWEGGTEVGLAVAPGADPEHVQKIAETLEGAGARIRDLGIAFYIQKTGIGVPADAPIVVEVRRGATQLVCSVGDVTCGVSELKDVLLGELMRRKELIGSRPDAILVRTHDGLGRRHVDPVMQVCHDPSLGFTSVRIEAIEHNPR